MMGVFQDEGLTNLCQCFHIFARAPGLLHIDSHCRGEITITGVEWQTAPLYKLCFTGLKAAFDAV